jgi:glutaredoxin 3
MFNQGKMALVQKLAGDYDAPAIRARIDKLVQENPVLMLSFTTCPYCIKAKQILDDTTASSSSSAKTYTVLELDTDAQGKAIRAELANIVGRTSMPAIWIGGTFVGGCNDGPGVATLAKSGKLEGLLKSAGAL